jgi:hypothetical protein
MTRIYRAFDGTEAAISGDDDGIESGHVTVVWDDGQVISDGWVEGPTLFVPQDAQTTDGTYLTADDPDAGWYEVESGRPAVVIAGHLAVIR